MNQKELLILSLTVFLTIIAWIIADLYHISTTEKVKINSTIQSQPLNIHIDENLINELEKKN